MESLSERLRYNAIMKTLFEFLLPYKGILFFIGTLINVALQFSPLARQFGEIAGNFALVLIWVMLSALALTWINKWKPQKCGWTLSLAKNGLRGVVLLLLFIPILIFNLPTTDSTIKISAIRVSPYEVGKPVEIELFMKNNNYSPIKLRGHYNVLVANRGKNSWPTMEDMIWGAMMSRPESDYPEFTIPTSDVHPRVVLENGPILTQEQVERLQKTDDASAIYFLGVFTYAEWYGRSRRLEFCGSYRDRPNYMIVCAKHREWADGLRGK